MNLASMDVMSKVKYGMGVSMALFILLAGISLYSITSMVEANKWVTHTQRVLGDAERIIGSAVDMETGMRGYLLAGKESFLAPYENQEEATYSRIDALKKSVSDNPIQVSRLSEAEKALQDWQENVAVDMIEMRRRIGDSETMNDMADKVGEGRGKVFSISSGSISIPS